MPNKKTLDLWLILTNKCNLACSYCYEQQNKQNLNATELSLGSIPLIIKFIESLDSQNKYENIRITFYGGESLLKFSLIKEIISKIRASSKSLEKFTYEIITNSTLLTDDILEYIVTNNIYIQTSLDYSKKIHDKHRVHPNGKGSYNVVMNKIKKLLESYYSPNMLSVVTVIGDEKIDLEELNEKYKSLGLTRFTVINARQCDNNKTFKEIHYSIKDSLNMLNHIIQNKMNENEIRSRKLILEIVFNKYVIRGFEKGNKYNYLSTMRCIDPKTNKIAISSSGDITHCPFELNNKDYCIGNIYKIEDFNKLITHINNQISSKSKKYLTYINKKCNHCIAKETCFRLCSYLSSGCGGNFYNFPDNFCKFVTQEIFPVQKSFYEYISKNNYKSIFN